MEGWLKNVEVTTEVYFMCMSHCLSTEREEVMGLILGNIDEEKRICRVWAISILSRLDKKVDRVEISPELLTEATIQAENLSTKLNLPTRVIGWYHSHPHITVLPSHVDIQTQSTYQYLDKGFVGLIFSCYDKDDVTKKGRVQTIAFQSTEDMRSALIPIDIVNNFSDDQFNQTRLVNNYSQIVNLLNILLEEEKHTYSSAMERENHIISKIHSSSIYEMFVCKLLEFGCYPLLQTFNDLLEFKQNQINEYHNNLINTPKKRKFSDIEDI